MKFEWDEEKRLANIAKHGIDFIDVCRLFDAPFLIAPDIRHNYGEDRSIAFGHVRERLMVVAFTKRQETIASFLRERQTNVKKRNLKTESRTDWKRVDAMKDEDVDLSDIPELDDDFFKNAVLDLPKPKATVTLRVDSDVIEWYRAKGKGYQTLINAVLKGWAEQHRA